MDSLSKQIEVLEKQIKVEISFLTKVNANIDSLVNTLEQLDVIKENIEQYNADIVIIANDFNLEPDDLKNRYTLPNKY